jgi:hypothetical protein
MTQDDRLKDTNGDLIAQLKQGVGAPIGNERTGATGQNGVQVAERSETVRDPARRTGMAGARSSGASPAGAHDYAALEADFRAHHETNAARRHGPYEHYRLVYRYGYELGKDTRYCSAEWSDVEREARPRWEERNPGTWEDFKDTIRYAWNTARSRR